MKQLVLDIIPAPAPSLANFVVGRNFEAIAALRNLLNTEATPTLKVLYLWGVSGCGKSHLINACMNAGFLPLAANAAAVTPDSSVGHAVDAVHALDAEAQHALFDLVNRQQGTSGVLVAAGTAAPRDLPLRRDLASRLGSGLVLQLLPLTDAEKAEALHVHARSRGFLLRDEVAAYLLRHSRRDMASLIQILDALDHYSLETGREITLPLLKEMSQPSLV